MENLYKSPFFKYWLPLITWAIIIIIISSIPGETLPEIGTEFWDKLAHLFIYLIFSLLFIRALKNLPREINHLIIVYSLSLLFALFDELHQYFIPGRDVEMPDLLSNWLGIFIGPFIFRILMYIKRHKERLRV